MATGRGKASAAVAARVNLEQAPPSNGVAQAERPKIGLPDPLEAAREEARHAKEGALKLARAIDALRTALETIVIAEVDNSTGRAVSVNDLKGIAIGGLDEYSQQTGQSWHRHKLKGSYAGDRNLSTLED